jgi:hypothetical protein
MQLLGLASTLSFYNLQQTLAKPKEKCLVITVGGLKYTSNIEVLKRISMLEEKYWNFFLCLPSMDSEKLFPKALNDKTNVSPPSGFKNVGESSLNKKFYYRTWEEGEKSKVYSFGNFEALGSNLALEEEEDSQTNQNYVVLTNQGNQDTTFNPN